MTEKNNEPRSSIIEAVKTPLGFLVLVLLVVEVTIGFLAINLEGYTKPLVWTIILSIPLFVITVVSLAIWRPEALQGDRPIGEMHASLFAIELHSSLEGPFSNLEAAERLEAWITVVDVISNIDQSNKSFSSFCNGVAQKLRVKAKIPKDGVNTLGPIKH